MQGRERRQLQQRCLHLIINTGWCNEPCPAMYDAVTDCINVGDTDALVLQPSGNTSAGILTSVH